MIYITEITFQTKEKWGKVSAKKKQLLYTDNHSDIDLNAIFLGMEKSNSTNARVL